MCVKFVDYIQQIPEDDKSKRDELERIIPEIYELFKKPSNLSVISATLSSPTQRKTFKIEYEDSSPDGYGVIEDLIDYTIDNHGGFLWGVTEDLYGERRMVLLNLSRITSMWTNQIPADEHHSRLLRKYFNQG